MASKIQERIYLEWFLQEKGIDYQTIDATEPPDFIVTLQDRRVAVEITNLYYEAKPGRKGSKRKKQESHRTRWLKDLSDSYYSKSSVPISLKILLPKSESYRDTFIDIQAALSRCRELDVWDSKRYIVESHHGTIKLFVHRLPEDFQEYSRWSCVNDRVGFVASVTEEHIVDAVNKKKQKIEMYQADCDEVWLLLVVDRSWKSGLLQYSGIQPRIESSGFDSVWLIEYLEQAHQLLGQ